MMEDLDSPRSGQWREPYETVSKELLDDAYPDDPREAGRLAHEEVSRARLHRFGLPLTLSRLIAHNLEYKPARGTFSVYLMFIAVSMLGFVLLAAGSVALSLVTFLFRYGHPFSALTVLVLALFVFAASVRIIWRLVHSFRSRSSVNVSEDNRRHFYRSRKRYVSAAAGLGSPSIEGRLASLRSMERAVQADGRERQAFVDLLCDLMRSPETGLELRCAAREIVVRHVDFLDGEFWSGLELNLRGANLPSLYLSNCRVRRLRLSDANISGHVAVNNLVVEGDLEACDLRVVGSLEFHDSRVAGGVVLSRVQVEADLVVRSSYFGGSVELDGASVGGDLTLSASHIVDRLNADRSSVGGDVLFREMKLSDRLEFNSVSVSGDYLFDNGVIEVEFVSLHSTVRGSATFNRSRLEGVMTVGNTYGAGLHFRRSLLAGAVTFSGNEGDVSFEEIPTVWKHSDVTK